MSGRFYIKTGIITNYADMPLRSLLPKGIKGVVTTGLGASAHRDAMPVVRMQPCLGQSRSREKVVGI